MSPHRPIPALCPFFIRSIVGPALVAFICAPVASVLVDALTTGKEAWAASTTYLSAAVPIVTRALGVSAITVFLSVPTAFFIRRLRSPPLRISVLLLAIVPFMTAPSIRAFAWSRLLTAGSVTPRLFAAMGIGEADAGLNYSTFSLWFVLIVNALPFGILGAYAVMPARVSLRWRAAEELDGSTHWAFASYAAIAAIPATLVSAVWMFAVSAFSSVEEQYVGNSISAAKIMTSVMNRSATSSGEYWSELNVIATCAAALLGLFAALIFAVRNAVTLAVSATVNVVRHAVFACTPPYWQETADRILEQVFLVLGGLLAWTAVVLGIAPVLWLLAASLSPLRGNASFGAMTLDHYTQLLSSVRTREAVANSILVASSVGLLAIPSSLVVGMTWFVSGRLVALLLTLLWTCALFPGEVYAISILNTFHISHGSLMLVIAGHLVWALPFCASGVTLALAQLPNSSIAAGLELDKNWLRTWTRTIIPMTWPALMAIGVFGFLLSLNESSRGEYLRGRSELLSDRVYNALNSGFISGEGQVLAAASASATLSLLLSLGIAFWAIMRYSVSVEGDASKQALG